jgi:transcriptional regulator with XRE-family HTH domain
MIILSCHTKPVKGDYLKICPQTVTITTTYAIIAIMVDDLARWLRRQFELNPSLNQTGLAIQIGVGQSTVSSWLRGAATPSYQNCIRLAEYFKAPKDEVLHLAGYAPRQEKQAADETRPDYEDLTFKQLLDLLRQLSPEEREEVLHYALFRFRRRERPEPPATGREAGATASDTTT